MPAFSKQPPSVAADVSFLPPRFMAGNGRCRLIGQLANIGSGTWGVTDWDRPRPPLNSTPSLRQ